MSRETPRAAEMRKVLGEFSKSGLTRREFCNKRGLSVASLDYWRRQLRDKPRLMKVEVARLEVASFTLRLANDRAIESSFPLAEEELVQLIRVAESA